MKKIFLVCTALSILLSNSLFADNKDKSLSSDLQSTAAMGDWRSGIWNRDVSENLINLDLEFIPVIATAFETTTPWAGGFNVGFEHKIRPSVIHNRFSFGFGGHLGFSRYIGDDILTDPLGHVNLKSWNKYKSYSEIPVMLDGNFYYNFHHSNIYIGVSAGINVMLGQRDAAVDSVGPALTSDLEASHRYAFGDDIKIISIQQDENNISINHIIPTFRCHLGYTYEISANFRLRVKAGLEYQMKYTDAYKGFYVGGNYIEYFHKHYSPSMMNPFINIGLSYSL